MIVSMTDESADSEWDEHPDGDQRHTRGISHIIGRTVVGDWLEDCSDVEERSTLYVSR